MKAGNNRNQWGTDDSPVRSPADRSPAFRVVFLMPLILALIVFACDDGENDSDDAATRPLPEGGDDDEDGDDGLAYTFPDGFMFGASTAGYQVDMGCPSLPASECADPNSDWYAYATDPRTNALVRTFLSGEDPAVTGPGHWELYEDDFDRAKNELGLSAFRMSIEWSRVFPASTVGVEGYAALREHADADALAHYHAVFAALRERGIAPLVTLTHYTLPLWIHDGVGCTLDLDDCSPRGWLDPDLIVPEAAKYAGFVAREFGDEVDWWATQNEPFAVLLPGFLLPSPERTNPPAALLDVDAFKTAFETMIEAHARMVDAIRAGDSGDADGDGAASMAGIVYALAPVVPRDPNNALDAQAAENIFYLWNLAFLDGVGAGLWDDDFDGVGEPREGWEDRLDFLGVNYYVRITVEGLPFSLVPSLSPLLTLDPLTLVMDEVYPRGLYDVVTFAFERYGRPVVITENNGHRLQNGDEAGEAQSLVEHLSWAARAIEDGADLRGYCYWSLMDNVEWNHGSDWPTGFYAVDPFDPAKTRVPRDTVPVYAAITAAGGIPADLAEQYPIE